MSKEALRQKPHKEFRRTVSLPEQDPDHELVVERVPKNKAEWADINEVHPELADFKLIEQGPVTGNDGAEYIEFKYRKLPGPIITRTRSEEGFGFPIKFKETNQLIATPATIPDATVTVAAGVATLVEHQEINKAVTQKITAVIDFAQLGGANLLYGTPFRHITYGSRSESFPDEIRGIEYGYALTSTGSLLTATAQRARGYSGQVDCWIGRRMVIPADGTTHAVTAPIHRPVKWFTDNISAEQTQSSTAPSETADVYRVGAMLNGALHDVVYQGFLILEDGVDIVGTPKYVGYASKVDGFITKIEEAFGITVASHTFRGFKFPATQPKSLAYADIEASFPASVRDFGTTFRTAMGLAVGEEKMVCIGITKQEWRFGVIVEDYWFCPPVRQPTARDFSVFNGIPV